MADGIYVTQLFRKDVTYLGQVFRIDASTDTESVLARVGEAVQNLPDVIEGRFLDTEGGLEVFDFFDWDTEEGTVVMRAAYRDAGPQRAHVVGGQTPC